jgi:hypothetical protein
MNTSLLNRIGANVNRPEILAVMMMEMAMMALFNQTMDATGIVCMQTNTFLSTMKWTWTSIKTRAISQI